jgi:hypothetical protein
LTEIKGFRRPTWPRSADIDEDPSAFDLDRIGLEVDAGRCVDLIRDAVGEMKSLRGLGLELPCAECPLDMESRIIVKSYVHRYTICRNISDYLQNT